MHRNRWGRWFAGVAVVADRRGLREVLGRDDAAAASAATREHRARRVREHRAGGQPAAAAATCKGDGSKGEVKMMINQWVGAAANVGRRPVPAPADGLQGHDEHPRRGGRLAGLRRRARST